ncbi:MAG TPA: FAD:protein FMN transferase [Verrucomicrobiae bacterium]|nr:FAD:protein FMN transferase [Verrucomicrobiae bacterium]
MATRFELVLNGDNPVALRAAGEEALDEIERLEAQLSLFRPISEIARVNARAAYEPVRVTPAVLDLLEHARQLSEQTDGAFDVTIAPLMRCWGFLGGSGQLPEGVELAAARQLVGMALVHLDAAACTIRFERPGVMIDLGAIGKGYAIDRAVEVLRQAGVESALIHGGTSTVYGLGHPPEADCWKVEIPGPSTLQARLDEKLSHGHSSKAGSLPSGTNQGAPESTAPFAVVSLRDESLSVSAIWGKFFHSNGQTFGHVIDPRSGQPANRAILSAVILPSATETDALSTALLTVGPEGHDRLAALRIGMKTLVLNELKGIVQLCARGIQVASCANGSSVKCSIEN